MEVGCKNTIRFFLELILWENASKFQYQHKNSLPLWTITPVSEASWGLVRTYPDSLNVTSISYYKNSYTSQRAYLRLFIHLVLLSLLLISGGCPWSGHSQRASCGEL